MQVEETGAAGDAVPRVAATDGPLRFPEGFVWGAATAAYQIEGAATLDGRGPSIWDTFSHTPGKVRGGATGDVACDHYHRYPDDVALMAGLGLAAYRFSVAWPRIQPDGMGAINKAGLDFYDRLVDTLLEHGIAPIVTLYHWDLPQSLEDRGGWTARDTALRFAEFAAVVHGRIGDRVHAWNTLNEPWCAAFLGYASGLHAPGRTEPGAAFAAVHHLLLAHGLATQALRADGAEQVGLAVNPVVARAADPEDPSDVAAARLVDGLQTRLFLDPLFGRGYPEDVAAVASRHGGLAWLQDGDLDAIAVPIDLLGINYYQPNVVAASPGESANATYPGTEDIRFVPPPGPLTAMGWGIDASGLFDLLVRLDAEYPGVPIWITENGAAFDDRVVDGRVADTARIDYLDGHLRAVHAAITHGVDVPGYLVWSLLDNFEWAEGYEKRFGMVHVDYETQVRVPKDSAAWYRGVIRSHALPSTG